jgi:anti-sigma regulatory factor (Ser/Thr protein kinase)
MMVDDHRGTRLELRLHADPAAVSASRRSIEAVPEIARDPQLLLNVQLVVSELVTNGVRHGGSVGPLWVSLAIQQDVVRLEVIDTGEGFDRGEVLRAPQNPAAVSGRGLHLVDAIADRWGLVSDGRTRVWVEFELGERAG